MQLEARPVVEYSTSDKQASHSLIPFSWYPGWHELQIPFVASHVAPFEGKIPTKSNSRPNLSKAGYRKTYTAGNSKQDPSLRNTFQWCMLHIQSLTSAGILGCMHCSCRWCHHMLHSSTEVCMLRSWRQVLLRRTLLQTSMHHSHCCRSTDSRRYMCCKHQYLHHNGCNRQWWRLDIGI